MVRGRLSMELIQNEKARKTTFMKRKNSLMTKAYQLSTLCDVRICVLVYGPKQKDQSAVLETWPKDPSDVEQMISLYKAGGSKKRSRKSFDLTSFFGDRKKKVELDISKLQRQTFETKYPCWNEYLDRMGEDELKVLLKSLDSKIDLMNKMIKIMKDGEYSMAKGTAPSIIPAGHHRGESSQNPANYMREFEAQQQVFGTLSDNRFQFPISSSPLDQAYSQTPVQFPAYQQNPFCNQTIPAMYSMDDVNYSQIYGIGSSSSNIHRSLTIDNPNFVQMENPAMLHDPYSLMCHYELPVQSISTPYMQLPEMKPGIPYLARKPTFQTSGSSHQANQFDCINSFFA